jgi:hypothetical protein
VKPRPGQRAERGCWSPESGSLEADSQYAQALPRFRGRSRTLPGSSRSSRGPRRALRRGGGPPGSRCRRGPARRLAVRGLGRAPRVVVDDRERLGRALLTLTTFALVSDRCSLRAARVTVHGEGKATPVARGGECVLQGDRRVGEELADPGRRTVRLWERIPEARWCCGGGRWANRAAAVHAWTGRAPPCHRLDRRRRSVRLVFLPAPLPPASGWEWRSHVASTGRGLPRRRRCTRSCATISRRCTGRSAMVRSRCASPSTPAKSWRPRAGASERARGAIGGGRRSGMAARDDWG